MQERLPLFPPGTPFYAADMRAEVIAIGDELTTGQRLDTNSQWLSQRLTEMGVHVGWHSTVGDDIDDNIAAFRTAFGRSDIIVTTGGLGPTADDLTREALAQATRTHLVRDEPSLAHIEHLFASRGREMPARNRMQADFPEGAVPIPNPNGTAPGIEMQFDRGLLFALPGVPAEMHEMWEVTVAPRILAMQPEPRVTRHRRIKCFGAGESKVESMLPNLIRRDRQPRVGITASDATITLRITATGQDEMECQTAMEPTVATIYESLGNLVFGEEEDELQDIVVRLLGQRGASLAVAEWATEGLVGEWLQQVDKDRRVIKTFEQISHRGEIPEIPEGAEDSSSEISVFLAESVREKEQVDIGLSIAAFPHDVDTVDAHVCMALAFPERTRKLRFPCAAHPAIRRSRTAKQALNALRLILLES